MTSLQAVAASPQGWRAQIVTSTLAGDVADAADLICRRASAVARGQKTLLIFGGETTVNVTGSGKGGRNQDLALRIALRAADLPGGDWLFLSGGTDGRDGPTDAAGGIVDAQTIHRIQAAGGDPVALLANNDAYRALQLADDLLITGPTGTNVADVQLLYIA